MQGFTLTEAARLVGTSRRTLSRAITDGRLECDREGRVTLEALHAAGFRVPEDSTPTEPFEAVDETRSVRHETLPVADII